MKRIPFLLIYSRILIAICIIIIAFFLPGDHSFFIAILIVLGLLTDVFDGIIARKLGVATNSLRVWDSNVDVFFWLSVFVSVFYMKFDIVKPILFMIYIVAGLEVLTYLVCFVKFKKTIATHTYLAKFWTITLLVFIVELLVFNTSKSFLFCFWIGVISRIEIVAIILVLKKWQTDVATVFSLKK